MNLPKIQALVAPLSAPVPSALGVAAEAYNYFAKMDTSGVWGWIAGAGAFIGIETLGGASCYALISLHRQRNYGIEFWIALAGILAYVGSGLYTLADSPIIIFFFLAPFSYFAYSILRSMDVELIAKTTETETQIKLIEAQIKQLNAETRKARAANVVATPKVYESTSYKTYICPYCEQDQGKPQRYSVHMRYCEKKPREEIQP